VRLSFMGHGAHLPCARSGHSRASPWNQAAPPSRGKAQPGFSPPRRSHKVHV